MQGPDRQPCTCIYACHACMQYMLNKQRDNGGQTTGCHSLSMMFTQQLVKVPLYEHLTANNGEKKDKTKFSNACSVSYWNWAGTNLMPKWPHWSKGKLHLIDFFVCIHTCDWKWPLSGSMRQQVGAIKTVIKFEKWIVEQRWADWNRQCCH